MVTGSATLALDEIRRQIGVHRKDRALAQLRALVEDASPLDGHWEEAARLATQLGDDDLALIIADRWIGSRPENLDAHETRIDALQRLGRVHEALDAATHLRSIPGGEPAGRFHEGVCLAFLARPEESLEALRGSLKLDSRQTRVWDYITAQKTFEPGDRDLMKLQKAYRRLGRSDPNLLGPVIHALGRAYDDIGHAAGAYQKFTEVGKLARKHAPYDVEAPVRYCERLAETFSPEFLQQHGEAPACANATPVFVIGPPRSGTTLLERMLSMHPAVSAGGEHSLLRAATYALGNFEPAELERALHEDAGILARCGGDYVARVRERFGPAERITDKTPINHFFVGVLHLALPNAALIWARRDLRDTAWSCFKTRLQGNRWTEDINDTVAYLRAYERLMAHWKQVLGERLLVVDYERLVEDPAGVMEQAFVHVGLSPTDDWRRFHETTSSVTTASMRQVREPLNRRSVGAWRVYEKFLSAPFRELAAPGSKARF